MQFHRTNVDGVMRIEIERLSDERGYFARTWCDREAAAAGLRTPMVQDSIAFNARKGTLRGLHYHADGFPQARVIRCTAGAAFLAAVDLRSGCVTFLEVFSTTLDAEDHAAVYVPPGVAVGYQTLVDRTTIHYQMPEFYDPQLERGVRWNDPAFAIRWPNQQPIINTRDASYPDFQSDARR